MGKINVIGNNRAGVLDGRLGQDPLWGDVEAGQSEESKTSTG